MKHRPVAASSRRRAVSAVAEPTLRTYRLERPDGTTDVVQAHVHDAGQTKPGHLTMYLVDPKGHLRPLVTYNARAWSKVSDISDVPAMSDALDLSNVDGTGDQTPQ